MPVTFSLRWIILLGATAVTVYLCVRVLWPFLDVIAWSSVLAITFYPMHRRFVALTGKPSLSAFFSSLLVVLTILVPVLLVTALMINEVANLKGFVEGQLQDRKDLSAPGPLMEALDWVSQHLGFNLRKATQAVTQHAGQIAQAAAKYSFAFAGNVTGLLVSFVFTVFTVFFLFRDGKRLAERIPDLLPFERHESETLLKRTRDVIDGSIYGLLVIALIQGGLGALAFAVLSVPSAMLWGLVLAFTSLIPLLGAAAVWAPCALYLGVSGHWGKAAILAAFGGLVISSVDNFLRPKLVGERIRLNELVMFFSVLGGMQVFGVLGIVLGPVLFAVMGSLFEAFRNVERRAALGIPPGEKPG